MDEVHAWHEPDFPDYVFDSRTGYFIQVGHPSISEGVVVWKGLLNGNRYFFPASSNIIWAACLEAGPPLESNSLSAA